MTVTRIVNNISIRLYAHDAYILLFVLNNMRGYKTSTFMFNVNITDASISVYSLVSGCIIKKILKGFCDKISFNLTSLCRSDEYGFHCVRFLLLICRIIKVQFNTTEYITHIAPV